MNFVLECQPPAYQTILHLSTEEKIVFIVHRVQEIGFLLILGLWLAATQKETWGRGWLGLFYFLCYFLYSGERAVYYRHRTKSRKDPVKYASIIIDGNNASIIKDGNKLLSF